MGRKSRVTVGDRFGMLTVIERGEHDPVSRKPHWVCRCDCGNTCTPLSGNLLHGRTKSCGCGEGKFTHGMTYRREYGIWRNMKARCANPSNQFYAGRGIKVCARWERFENFYADMGDCPPGMTLERRDNDGDYEPSNCVWATRAVQARNRRSNVWITWKGERLCLRDWSVRFNTDYNMLRYWLQTHSVNEVFSRFVS